MPSFHQIKKQAIDAIHARQEAEKRLSVAREARSASKKPSNIDRSSIIDLQSQVVEMKSHLELIRKSSAKRQKDIDSLSRRLEECSDLLSEVNQYPFPGSSGGLVPPTTTLR